MLKANVKDTYKEKRCTPKHCVKFNQYHMNLHKFPPPVSTEPE